MSKSNFKAIPTSYDGINFRSRLEAKWAAFFHLMGWDYEYEPIDLDGYIPDFVLTGCKTPIYVEVKPALTFKELLELCEKARRATLGKKLLCLGATIGYAEDPLSHPGSLGSLVSRINVCDEDMLNLYANLFGDGNKDASQWRTDDPSAQHCILGYHEHAEVRRCEHSLCCRLAPISMGYKTTCPFCETTFPEIWGWEDHKADFRAAIEVWKEAGNVIQYRYSKTF